MTPDDRALQALFAPARTLEPSAAEVRRVLATARPAPALRRLRIAAAALALLLVVGAAGYSTVPPVRAAIDDVANTFGGWMGGDDSAAPGRALQPGEAPYYFRDNGWGDEARLIAEADGYKLLAVRESGGYVMFDLGDTGVALSYSAKDFDHKAVYVLGPGAVAHADESGHVPLFGVTARSVVSVDLTYASGEPLRVDDVNGGFVLLAEPERAPHEVIARDAHGEVVERVDVRYIGWRDYGPPGPRVPSRCLPGPAGPTPPPDCP